MGKGNFEPKQTIVTIQALPKAARVGMAYISYSNLFGKAPTLKQLATMSSREGDIASEQYVSKIINLLRKRGELPPKHHE